MWEFNEVDRDNNYLAHGNAHKYITKEWKNGRWVYTYSDNNLQRNKVAARVREAYGTSRDFRARSRAYHRNILADDKERERYRKNEESSRFRKSRVEKARKNSAIARKVIEEGPPRVRGLDAYRSFDIRALRRYNDTIDAANASIKSKKSLKRKAKKAYYKTRDAVRSIPSPINTHKVYKAGNQTTVIDERGPLISTKSNRKSRKKKRG